MTGTHSSKRQAARLPLRFLAILTVALWIPVSVFALEPPTKEQIARYKADGTWHTRAQMARQYGNHKMSPALVARLKAKLKALAEGRVLKPSDMKTPPLGWQNMPTTGTVRIPIFLVAFDDYPPYNDAASIENKIFGSGDASKFPYESLHYYYDRSSYGQLDIEGDVYGWYTTSYPRSDVGTNRGGREALLKEVFQYFDGEGADFSVYDNDGSGAIDYFAVIWTGPHGEWAEFWWGYQTHFQDSSFTVDGVRLDAYSWQWETYNYPDTYDANMNPDDVAFSPKTLIHETGHALGLPDYYDYDDTQGPNGGVGGLDIMAGTWGDHNCFSKWVLDWITPQVQTQGSQVVTLNPSATSEDAMVLMPDITGDTPFDEFFMVQYRKRDGNDTTYPTDGLLIWHVDARLDTNGYDYLYDNSYTEHKLLRLMEADGQEQIEQGNWADAGDFYKSGNVFSPVSTPNSNKYDGTMSRLWIKDIGSTDTTMSFTAAFEGIPAYLPHFTLKTGYWSTRLTLVNDNRDDADCTLTLFDGNGTQQNEVTVTVPGQGGVTDLIPDFFPTAVPEKGWIQVGSPTRDVSGLMTFQYLPTGASSSLPLTYAGGTRLIFPLMEQVDGRSSGFAIVNISDLPTDVTLKLYRMNGTAAGMVFLNIPAHGKLVDMLENVFNGPLPERSILKVDSDHDITGFALIFTSGNTNVIAVPASVSESSLQ